MRNAVRFNSSLFNSTDPRDYFIKPDSYGDDVGEWLKPRLEAAGYQVAGPAQEEWGWRLECAKAGAAHTLNIGYLGEQKDGSWEIFITRYRSFGERLLGRNGSIDLELARELHSILSSSPKIQVLSWVKLVPPFGESEKAAEP
jgi:hypothetical protein